ncbi:MAG: hypothetical protein HQM09_16180 [Candidatus Riflebacteria bacterium]|nr:hypothetical protein [Candidatus Riflebacteria bacterium]
MDNELAVTLECLCGAVFEPEELEVDAAGERWAQCPKCQIKIPVPELI